MGQQELKHIAKFINEEISLRPMNAGKVAEYAERLKLGVTFPPIMVGSWPKSDKYGESGVVDGLHRLMAAKEAGLKSFEVTEMKFNSLQEALTYMYQANMAHGLTPTEGQRNARIKLIRKIEPDAGIEKLAKEFKLSTSSIDRIIKDQQGEGKSGPKTGTKKNAAHKNLEPLKPKAVLSACERIVYTLTRVRPAADLVAFCQPEGEEGLELDQDKFDLLVETVKLLQGIVKELK